MIVAVLYWVVLLLWFVLDVFVFIPPPPEPPYRRGLGVLLFLLFVFIGIGLWGNPFNEGPPRR